MPGPPPKDPRTRQRRNKVPTDAHLEDGNPIDEKLAPPLPAYGVEGEDWHPATVEAWREIWASPMAAEFVRADVHGLVIYARVLDKVEKGNLSYLGEWRLQRAAWGLDSMARRRLGWVVSKKDGPAKPQRPQRKRAGDPRALRAVT